MEFDYFVAPAIFLLVGALVAKRAVKHLRSLPTRYSNTWPRIFDRVIIFMLVLGSAALAISSSFNAFSLVRFRQANFPTGALYTVNGHRMHLNCSGTGSPTLAPTLVLDAGLGNDSLIWGSVQPQLAKTTRVCSYDRAGFGFSDPVSGPRDADHIALELHQLLQQANISGPIVLMGHSIAGMYIRDYAARYPNQVAGLIFVDGSTPLQDENPAFKAAGETGIPRWASIIVMRSVFAAGLPRIVGSCARPMAGFDPHASDLLAEDLCHPQYGAVNQELSSFNASGRETAHTGPFGDLPVLIISQDPQQAVTLAHGSHQVIDMENAWGQMQEDLKQLSTHSRRIIARGSSHAVQIDRPDLLITEVPKFIDQIRGTASEPATYGKTIIE